jgi:hypothetical protein
MPRRLPMLRIMQVLACLLVFKAVLVVFANYRDYFPANFARISYSGAKRPLVTVYFRD